MDNASLNMNIRTEMVRRGETQRSLSTKLDIAQPTISRRLRGEVNWTINDLYDLAAVLRVPLPKLLEGVEGKGA